MGEEPHPGPYSKASISMDQLQSAKDMLRRLRRNHEKARKGKGSNSILVARGRITRGKSLSPAECGRMNDRRPLTWHLGHAPEQMRNRVQTTTGDPGTKKAETHRKVEEDKQWRLSVTCEWAKMQRRTRLSLTVGTPGASSRS